MSDPLWVQGSQHSRPPCPSPTAGVHPNPCPLCRWCHPTISSSVLPFFSCLQSFQHQGLFKWVSSSHQVAQSIGVSASPSVLPVNTQDWSLLGWTGWTSWQSCRVQFMIPEVAHQALLSMGFSRQECWSGLPFPSPGYLNSFITIVKVLSTNRTIGW